MQTFKRHFSCQPYYSLLQVTKANIGCSFLAVVVDARTHQSQDSYSFLLFLLSTWCWDLICGRPMQLCDISASSWSRQMFRIMVLLMIRWVIMCPVFFVNGFSNPFGSVTYWLVCDDFSGEKKKSVAINIVYIVYHHGLQVIWTTSYRKIPLIYFFWKSILIFFLFSRYNDMIIRYIHM